MILCIAWSASTNNYLKMFNACAILHMIQTALSGFSKIITIFGIIFAILLSFKMLMLWRYRRVLIGAKKKHQGIRKAKEMNGIVIQQKESDKA